MCLPVRKLVISMTSQEACMNVTIKEFLKVSNAQSVFSTVAAAQGNLLQDLSSSQIAICTASSRLVWRAPLLLCFVEADDQTWRVEMSVGGRFRCSTERCKSTLEFDETVGVLVSNEEEMGSRIFLRTDAADFS